MTKIAERIEVNPNAMAGKPRIRRLRISVEKVLKALAAGIPSSDGGREVRSRPCLCDRGQVRWIEVECDQR